MPATTFKFMTPARLRLRRSAKRWTPHAYQRKALKFLLEHGAAGLFLDPGLGKTSIVAAAAKVLKNEGLLGGLLVLGPLRPIQEVWPEELDGWRDFHDLDYVVLHGDNKDADVAERHDIYLINFEGLKWLIDRGHLKRLLKKGWITRLVVDELSKMKHTDTQRFKKLRPYLGEFVSRWGLTGSPAANGLMNLFGQVYILDGGNAFGPYITYWRAEFFNSAGVINVQVQTPRGMITKSVVTGWAPKPGAEEAIYQRLRPLVLRMDADDYLRLPKVLNHTVSVTLPPKARKLYDQMEKELVIQLEQGIVTAANAATAIGKCAQIASGALYHHPYDPITGEPVKRGCELVHTAKLDALLDLIDELQGKPLWCAYEWVHERERICAALDAPGAPTPWIGGGTTGKRLTEIKDAWNAGELPYCFGQPQSVAHGLNFQKSHAAHVGYFTVPYDYELYDQFMRRLRRQGNQSEWMHVYHFVVKDTVDEDRVTAVRTKKRGQDALFRALQARLLPRK